MVKFILLLIQILFLCLMDEAFYLSLFCIMGHFVLGLLSCLMMPFDEGLCCFLLRLLNMV